MTGTLASNPSPSGPVVGFVPTIRALAVVGLNFLRLQRHKKGGKVRSLAAMPGYYNKCKPKLGLDYQNRRSMASSRPGGAN